MSWLKKLFGLADDSGPPVSAPVPAPAVTAAVGAPAPAERFNFRENLATSAGDTAAVAKHRPQAQTVYVEVLTDSGQVVASDTIELGRDQIAPKGPRMLGEKNEVECTYVVIGETGLAQQEFTVPLGQVAGLPFVIPANLTNKSRVGGTKLRIWWSCEEKTE